MLQVGLRRIDGARGRSACGHRGYKVRVGGVSLVGERADSRTYEVLRGYDGWEGYAP
jgi:hypothetical protein